MELGPRLWNDVDEPSIVVKRVEGIIFPSKVHRFLLDVVVGESAVSLGLKASAVSSFERETREDCRL